MAVGGLCREDQGVQGPGCPGPAYLARAGGCGGGQEVGPGLGSWHFDQSPEPSSPWLHSELLPRAVPSLGCPQLAAIGWIGQQAGV